MTLTLPFSTGIASQEYLVAEEGALRAHEEGCTHWYVDLSLPSDHAHQWPTERRKNLIRLTQRLEIQPIIHGNFRAPFGSEIPEIRQSCTSYLRGELNLAYELNAPLIIHGGAIVDPRPTESARWSALQRFVDITEEIMGQAAEFGVEVWVENLSHYPRFRPFSYIFTRYADYVTMISQVPDVKFIFDVGHANVNQQPPLQIFRECGSNIKAISVSDNDGRADSHLGLGRGTVPIEELVRTIATSGWSGLVAFETRGAAVADGVAALSATYTRTKTT